MLTNYTLEAGVVYPEPGEATEQGQDQLFVCGFEPDALQLAHS